MKSHKQKTATVITGILTSFVVPFFVSAQAEDVFDLLGLFAGWLGDIVPLLIGFIVLIIFWNMGQFILHAGDEREREKYKQFIVWSVVAMFLIISFWGIVYFIARSFLGDLGDPIYGNPGFINSSGDPVE